jgi:hypothetical protein
MATKKAEPKKMGRPVEEVPQDKADEIIVWISNGQTLRDFCRIEGNPAFRTVRSEEHTSELQSLTR